MPILAFLIVGDGKLILVDTGCSSVEWSAANHRKIIKDPDMELLPAIRKAGFEPDDIDCIINTHLHWDHCYNNDELPNKKIYVQKSELLYAVEPWPAHYWAYETHHVGCVPPWQNSMKYFEVVDGDYGLYPESRWCCCPAILLAFRACL